MGPLAYEVRLGVSDLTMTILLVRSPRMEFYLSVGMTHIPLLSFQVCHFPHLWRSLINNFIFTTFRRLTLLYLLGLIDTKIK